MALAYLAPSNHQDYLPFKTNVLLGPKVHEDPHVSHNSLSAGLADIGDESRD